MTFAEFKSNQRIRFFRSNQTIKVFTTELKKINLIKDRKKIEVVLENGKLENIAAETFAFSETSLWGYYSTTEEDTILLKKEILTKLKENKKEIKKWELEIKKNKFKNDFLLIELALKLRRW